MAQTCTIDELEFCASAKSIDKLEVMCWPAPIEPKYLCKQPRPNAYPVLENSSLELRNLVVFAIENKFRIALECLPGEALQELVKVRKKTDSKLKTFLKNFNFF